jgi:hypothetical protein
LSASAFRAGAYKIEAVPKTEVLEQLPLIYWKNRVFGRFFQETVPKVKNIASQVQPLLTLLPLAP